MNEETRELKRNIRHEAKELGVTAKLIQESCELIANLSDFGHITIESFCRIQNELRDLEQWINFADGARVEMDTLLHNLKLSMINEKQNQQ